MVRWGSFRNLFTSRLATTDPRVWNGRWIDHGIGCGSGDGRACQNCGKKLGNPWAAMTLCWMPKIPALSRQAPSESLYVLCRAIEDAQSDLFR